MIHQADTLGRRAQSGFKREAWEAAVTKLNSECELSYDRDHLKSRNSQVRSHMIKLPFLDYGQLRWDYDAVRTIKGLSGFGCDSSRKLLQHLMQFGLIILMSDCLNL